MNGHLKIFSGPQATIYTKILGNICFFEFYGKYIHCKVFLHARILTSSYDSLTHIIYTYRDEVIHHIHWCFVVMCRYTYNFCFAFNIDVYFFPNSCTLLSEAKRKLFNLFTNSTPSTDDC